MKAWKIEHPYENYSVVVFAKTRGKARLEALYTDECGDCEFLELSPRRFPEADSMYTDGKHQLDWMNREDRIFLLKQGWYCDIEMRECRECEVKEYCDYYNDNKDEIESEKERFDG